ncbi:hypothetical protein [Maribacter sp. 2210JD10-5]|uniref:hypothetical protein n=1 Tax=Maribacter sp. 2210JD10-5 TaxID=3386272 RepID=UPI0039BCAA23
MKSTILSVLCIVVFLFACEDRDDNLATANIRIHNKSNRNFSTVQVRVDSLVFENVPSDGFSDYLEFEVAFQEDNITIETDSVQYNYTPSEAFTDSLPVGLYTYELDITEEGQVDFTFTIDN